MNWKHIEAMIKGTGSMHLAILDDGRKLITNEYMMLPFNDEFSVPEWTKYVQAVTAEDHGWYTLQVIDTEHDPLKKLWLECEMQIGQQVAVGSCGSYEDEYRRNIGVEWIDEAYFRCLSGPDVHWHYGPNGVRCMCAVIEGKLAGVVMPMVNDRVKEQEPPPSDEAVFARFCVPENDYYLITQDHADSKIEEFRDKMSANDDIIHELEMENVEFCRRIQILENLTRERNLNVARTTADAPSTAG